jgi:hypothetical protein
VLPSENITRKFKNTAVLIPAKSCNRFGYKIEDGGALPS